MLKGPSKFWVYLLICLEASQSSEFIYFYTQRPLKILSLLTHTLRASQDSEFIHSYILSAFTRTLKSLLRFWAYLLAHSKASQLKNC